MQSFVMMFQQQTEDIIVKWIANESKKWSSEQTLAFLERSLLDYDRKQKECIYDDARLMESKQSYTDYMEGRSYVSTSSLSSCTRNRKRSASRCVRSILPSSQQC